MIVNIDRAGNRNSRIFNGVYEDEALIEQPNWDLCPVCPLVFECCIIYDIAQMKHFFFNLQT